MCRNIKTLFNFDPPATDTEIDASSLQFVRKLSGFTKPSKANEKAFNHAVEDVASVARNRWHFFGIRMVIFLPWFPAGDPDPRTIENRCDLSRPT